MNKDFKSLFIMYKQFNLILTKKQKLCNWGVFLLITLGAVFETIGVTAIIPFVYAVMQPEELVNNEIIKYFVTLFGMQSTYGVIALIGAFIIFVYIFKNLFLMLVMYVQQRFACGLKKSLSTLMLKSYLERPYEYFLEASTAQVLRGVNTDVESIHSILDSAYKILSVLFMIVGITSFIFLTDPIMALGVSVILAVIILLMIMVVKKKTKQMGIRQREISENTYRFAYEAVNGIKEIKIANKQDWFVKNYSNAYEEKRRIDILYQCFTNWPEKIIEGLCVSGLIGIVLIRLALGVNVEDFIPSLASFAISAFRIMPSVSTLSVRITQLIYLKPALQEAYDNITEARKYMAEKYAETEFGEKIDFENKLTISELYWKYPKAAENVLNGVSFEIKKGEAIGLIGKSGAGKTTLGDLILGLVRPQEGAILVDDININKIPKQWSEMIGYVPQNVFLMDDTIRNNILFGIEAQKIDDEEIWKSLEKAQLKTFVEALPEKLETKIGERGIRFSGGQKQRLAIARVLFQNPDIIVLDEATSALDTETESAVMEAIENLQGEKTLLIVAHRLTTLEKCDRVYEIVDGRIELQ